MTRATFTLIASLLFAVSLPAADPQWIQMTSDHFRVFSSAKERETRAALEHLERVSGFFAQLIGHTPSASAPVDVVIFGSEKEYEPVRINEFAVAYYSGQSEHDYIVIGKTGEQANSIVAHEYTHLAFRHGNYNLPPWLSEGVAELFSTLKGAGKNTVFGEPIPGRLQELRSEKWVPLRTILEADQASPYYNETKRAGSLYNESWLLVHMMATSGTPAKFANLLDAVRLGTPSVTATERIFAPLPELDKAVQLYLVSGRFAALQVPIKLPQVDRIQATPASPYSVHLVLADLVAGRAGQEADARKRYEDLKLEDPNRPEAWSGLAYLDWRANNREQAVVNFAKAFDLGARSPKLLGDFARLGFSSQPEKALAAMKLYVSTQPDNVAAWIDLATMQMSQRQFADALLTAKSIRAVNTNAQRDRILFVRASAAMQTGDRTEARKIAEELQRLAEAPELKRQAGEMLAYLDRTEPTEEELEAIEAKRDREALPKESNEPTEAALAAAAEAAKANVDAPPALLPAPVLTESVNGKLIEMVCATPGKMILETEKGKKEFLILNPGRLIVTGREGGAQLTCGPQKPPVPVSLKFTEAPEGSNAAGAIRSVHFEATK
jgi:tetratricopeptide (TPR) repeat protein